MIRLVVVLFCLSGCVHTLAGVRNNKPDLQATTQKTPQQLVECVAPRWADIYGTPNVIPSTDGLSIVIATTVEPEIILDVKNDGSVVFYKVVKLWMNIDDRLKEAVRTCI